MKKNIIFILLFSLIFTFSSFSYADQKKVLKSHTTSEVTVVRQATVTHYTTANTWGSGYCSTCKTTHYNGSPHCISCGKAHSQADFAYNPSCACSNTTPGSAPSGYTKVKTVTETKVYGCNNSSRIGAGAQEAEVTCTLVYDIYEKKEEPKPTIVTTPTGPCHEDSECSKHKSTYTGNHDDYIPSYTAKKTCTSCQKTYYTGVTCKAPEVQEETITPIPTGPCHEDDTCSTHSATYTGNHGSYIAEYTSKKTCSKCNKTYYTGVTCYEVQEEEEEEEEKESCNIEERDGGQTASRSNELNEDDKAIPPTDTYFSAAIDPTDSLQNPVRQGDLIKVGGQLHVDRELSQSRDEKTKYYDIYKYYYGYCTVHDSTSCSGCSTRSEYVGQGSYTVVEYGTPNYSDTRHSATVTFKGFRIDGSKTKIISPSRTGKTYGESITYEYEPFDKSYTITEIVTSELQYDEKGLAYGTVTVKCSCGQATCATSSMKVYIKFIEDEVDKSTLTVSSQGNGKISLNSRLESLNDYISAEWESINTIKAIPDEGYVFVKWLIQYGDNWPEEYSKSEIDVVVMPKQDVRLIAVFEEDDSTRQKYNIGVYSDGNGFVSMDGSEQLTQIVATVNEETVINIVAHNNEKFKFKYWEVIAYNEDETPVITQYTEEEQEISIGIYKNYVFIAHFEPIGEIEPYGRLEVKTPDGDKGFVFTDVEYAIIGEEYTIHAISLKNNEFKYWNEESKPSDKLSTSANHVVTMPDVAEYVIIGHFDEDSNGGSGNSSAENEYTIIIKVEGDGNVVTGDGTITSGYISNTYYSTPLPAINGVVIPAPIDNGVILKGKVGDEFTLRSDPNTGSEFVGLYEENGSAIDYSNNAIVKFTDKDQIIISKFEEKLPSSDKEINSFKVNSIRDLRWQNYFTKNGKYNYNNALSIPANSSQNTVLVNKAQLLDSEYNKYKDIVYGYAVELGLETVSLDLNKDNPELTINVTIYGDDRKLSANDFTINGSKDEAKKFFSFNSKDNKEEFIFTSESFTRKNNGYDYPGIDWSWIYYLPVNMEYNNRLLYTQFDKITVEFDVIVSASGIKDLDYLTAIKNLGQSNWGGKVFNYRTNINGRPYTVLDDLDNNLTY